MSPELTACFKTFMITKSLFVKLCSKYLSILIAFLEILASLFAAAAISDLHKTWFFFEKELFCEIFSLFTKRNSLSAADNTIS